jgi:hypothetical protein
MLRCRGALLLVLCARALGACASSPPPLAARAPGLPVAPALRLPPDWRTMALDAFEAWALFALPEGRATPFEKESLLDLRAALDEGTAVLADGRLDPLAVRAAVILGRSRYPTSAAILVRRLEKRVLGPERHSDCGDALAAAALARFPDPRRYAPRLVPLAVGPRPHPDLEVRVECAATALAAGFDEVVPFLLQVLRIDTFAGRADARDFTVSPTTAWARGRAAEALSLRAGVPVTYRFDGSIPHREEEARALELRLAP